MKVDSPLSTNNNQTQRVVRMIPLWPALVTLVIVAAIFYFLGTHFSSTNIGASGLNYGKLDQIYTSLQQKYVGKLDNQKLIDGAASGMVDALGDQYTEFFTADQAKQFNSDLNGTLSGVGIQLGQNAQGQLSVIAPLDHTPAKAAGIQAGDVISKINGKDSLTMSADVASNTIRGKAGTTVTLTIIRAGASKDYKLTRANITVPSTTWKVSNDNGQSWANNDDPAFAQKLTTAGANGIGYIRISSFAGDTANLSAQAAQAFAGAGVKKVILDLRGNGGGYVDAAQSLVSLWLPQGDEIVKELGKNNALISNATATGDPTFATGTKTVVLIDGGSASASEITAAALRDNKAATLIGTKSYGKGCMQELVNLQDGAQLKVTVANWYTPAGKNITGHGIAPDTVVPMNESQINSGDDVQLKAAVTQVTK
ncbi:MAG: S41 family peptidase [Candidatus Nanoperiomorbaceae bacterium]